MDLNIISKIFPLSNKKDLLSYDEEGLYSITLPNEANVISSLICSLTGSNIEICDATAGIGGNTISFAKKFKKVFSIEINEERFEILKNNVDAYDISNVEFINDSCLTRLNLNVGAYFFDPPWGGPEYKTKENITFRLGDKKLIDVVKEIKAHGNKLVFLKLPNNYNISEFSEYNYAINKIKNYQLITIY